MLLTPSRPNSRYGIVDLNQTSENHISSFQFSVPIEEKIISLRSYSQYEVLKSHVDNIQIMDKYS